MAIELKGTPSDQLPRVLATGLSSATCAFISFSAREPLGRDAEYIEWHSLDHRPEQFRLPQLRNALRLVSTPACRRARAASVGKYDEIDHVMTYLFTGMDGLPGFFELGVALEEGQRMQLRLPSVGYVTAELAGKVAAPRAVAGADVIPWRPALGVYIIIERGQVSPAGLIDLPGVAGIWWWNAAREPEFEQSDGRGLQITYCYLDENPAEVAGAIGRAATGRWRSGEVVGLLAAPFQTLVPYSWSEHLPS